MDFHAPRDADPEPLVEARRRFEGYLELWITTPEGVESVTADA
jgi:hypothetical protein